MVEYIHKFAETKEPISIFIESSLDYILIISTEDAPTKTLTFYVKFSYFSNRFTIEDIVSELFDAVDQKRDQFNEFKSIVFRVHVVYAPCLPKENLSVKGYAHMDFLLATKKNWRVLKESMATFGEMPLEVDMHVFKDGNLTTKPSYVKTVQIVVNSTDPLYEVEEKLRGHVIAKKTHYIDYTFSQFFTSDMWGADIEIFEDNSLMVSTAMMRCDTSFERNYFCCHVVYDSSLLF